MEKAPPEFVGGNARVSGQSLLISKNAEALKSYHRAMSADNPVPESILEDWAARMVALEPWIEKMASDVGAEYLHGTAHARRSRR